MRLQRTLAIAVMAAMATTAPAQTTGVLTLSKAVDEALRNNPLVRSAQLGIDLADKRVDQERTSRLPTVRVSETITRGNNPVFVFGSLLEQARFGAQNFSLPALNNPQSITNLRTVLSANLAAFDGMRTSSRIAQAHIEQEQAALEKTLAEQRIRFEVVRDYFGVLVAGTALQVAEEAMRMGEADIKQARDRLETGLAVQSDLLAAQVQLAEFRQQRIQAQGDLATAFTVLNVSIGAPLNTHHTLTSDLRAAKFELLEPEELTQKALLHRADYQRSQSGIDLADRRVSERRSQYLPELNVFASAGSSGRNLTTGSADYSVGAAVTFNLFDAGRSAKLEEARIGKSLAESERDRIGDEIRVEVMRAPDPWARWCR
jgi:outer membrane protein TolC